MKYSTLHSTEVSFKALKPSHAHPGFALTQDDGVVHLMPTMRPVDLGLSVKWGEYNIGAIQSNSASTWVGNYYQWGEVETKDPSEFTWLGYKFHSGDEEYSGYTKYTTANSRLESIDDVATYELGKGWRMPTKAEMQELLTLQYSRQTNYADINGLNGVLFEGSDDSIFIPSTGGYLNGELIDDEEIRLFTAELWNNNEHYACTLYDEGIGSQYYRVKTGVWPRFAALQIRPVFDESLL